MPDDPKKKGAADRRRVSQQHEQRYQARKAKKAGAKKSGK
jgi:hypothetical protein